MLIFSSFLLGLTGSWIMMKYGEAIGVIDIPNSRSSHHKVIPKGAGIGILCAFIFFSLILKIKAFLWVPGLIVSLTSFWGGDKHMLPVIQRLFIHFGCSLMFLWLFFYSEQVDPMTYLLSFPISVFIVGTANYYNFMDGIDGIAGITGFLAFSMVAFYNAISGMDKAYGSLSLVIAFSCLGFLCLNIPKAKIFLGDVGSILLGFIFACMIIVLSKNIIDFFVMAGFLLPFYFDELFTMVVRIKNKDSLMKPHRKHLYQLLANEAGIDHLKISIGYGVLQLIIGFSAILSKPKGLLILIGIYLFYCLLFSVFSIIIRRKYHVNES